MSSDLIPSTITHERATVRFEGLHFNMNADEALYLRPDVAQRLALHIHCATGVKVAVITHGPARYPRQQLASIVTPAGSLVHPKVSGETIRGWEQLEGRPEQSTWHLDALYSPHC